MVVTLLSIWKVSRVIIYLMTAMVLVIAPLIGSVTKGVRDGDWSELRDKTGGMILASDVHAKQDILDISNETLRELYPEKYNSDYIDYKKSKIFTNLAILTIWGLLFWWLFMKIVGEPADTLIIRIFGIVVAIFAVILLEEIYLLLTGGMSNLQVPLQSIYYLFKNWEFIIQTGTTFVPQVISNATNSTNIIS